jgi:hypothetical protein
MKQNQWKKNFRQPLIVCGLCLLFTCTSIAPVMGGCSQQHFAISSPLPLMQQSDGGDIPTWYPGDQWVYKVDPLYVSSPNASFSGTIQNFKQKVVGVSDGWYTMDITGQISGQVVINGVPGQLNGQITGASSVRVSDLAEGGTELHSQGTITMMYIPFPYEMTFVTSSSPPLELYDFPLYVGEQWQISCMTFFSGSLTVQGFYEQSFNGSQWVDETATCLQKKPISVPAGTFECFEIGRSRSENQAWYSTEAGNIVKSVVDQSDENMTVQIVMSLQSCTHVQQPITVSQSITPARVAPGVSVVISGQASSSSSGNPIQNGAISMQIPSTGDSWTTTTNSAGYYSKTIVAPTMSDDTPSGRETGSGGVIVHCTSDSLLGYRVNTLTTVYDTPPSVPSIHGPETGKTGVSYSYTFVSEDPENDDVFYFIDWGDGKNSSWVGPSASNKNITLSHTFTKKGSYTIKVQARDIFYMQSDWGTLQVTMPKQLFSSQLPRFFMRFPVIYAFLERFLRN